MCVYIGESWESSSATECTKTLTLSTSTSTLILSDPPYINIYIDPVQERSYSIEDFKMRLTWKGTYFFCYASTRYLQLDPFTHHHSSEPNIIHNICSFYLSTDFMTKPSFVLIENLFGRKTLYDNIWFTWKNKMHLDLASFASLWSRVIC